MVRTLEMIRACASVVFVDLYCAFLRVYSSAGLGKKEINGQRTRCIASLRHLPQFNDLQSVHRPDDQVGWIKFKPSLGKVRIIWFLMMIVLEQFAHHQEIKRQCIFAMVIVVEIGITVFM